MEVHLVVRGAEPVAVGGLVAVHGGEPGDLINQFFPEGIIFHRYEDKKTEVIAHLQHVGKPRPDLQQQDLEHEPDVSVR